MNKMMTAALMSLVFVGMCAGAEEAAEAVAEVTAVTETVQEAAAPAAPSTAAHLISMPESTFSTVVVVVAGR